MRTFTDFDQKTFEQLAKLTQPALKRVVSNYLRKHYKHVIETPDYVCAVGEIPIALVAHLDTVFKAPPEEIYFDRKKNVMWSCDGLGADDRAGVYAILQILRSGLRPHVVFCTDEEMGGIGAARLAALPCPFADLRYVIELDRKNANDAVFYDCANEEFTDYIESFGFTWSWGTFSDISLLCPAWKKAGVNLSVGYRDEHSELEVLFVGQLVNTIDKVKVMLQEEEIPEFEYIEDKSAWGSYFTTNGDDWYTKCYGTYSTVPSNTTIKCACCGKHYMEEEMFPAVMLNKTTGFYCPDCLVDQVGWCTKCNSAYQKKDKNEPDEGICILCQELKEKAKDDTRADNSKTV